MSTFAAAAANPVSRLPLVMPATMVDANSTPPMLPTAPSQRICCRSSGPALRARKIKEVRATKALATRSRPVTASATSRTSSMGSMPTGFVSTTPSISCQLNGCTAKPATVTMSDAP
ncbi:MAG: hypothetical protein ACRDGK_06065 [Actinomycetota bacterium]